MKRLTSIATLLISTLLSPACPALQRIAVLNFELNDITSLPNTPQEKRRTASIAPLLEQAIERTGGFEIIRIDAGAQTHTNASFGYLFRFNEVAAQLGDQYGADWVVVGQHSKPSFLESYLMAHLIKVKDRTLAAGYAVALKGSHEKVTERGVSALAGKIHAFAGQ